jgi:nitrate/TMAO reductase-like tetraheme cytochrome c subunit
MSRRLLTLLVFAALAAGAAVCPRWWDTTASATAVSREPEPQRRTRQTRRRPQRRPAAARVDYSKFSHSTAAHQRSCQSCHTIPTANWSRARAGEEAYPDVTDYPGHASCLDCHRRQFFSGPRPVICSVCHTNVSPRDGTRFAFRNPAELWAKAPKKNEGDSEFVTRFPHDRHQDVMAGLDPVPAGRGFGFVRASFLAAPQDGAAAEPLNSCTVCHKVYEPKGKSDGDYVKAPPEEPKKDALGREEPFWFKKGTMMTTPASHASCFSCHWQEGGVEPLSSQCDKCHTLLTAGLKLQLQLEGADAEPEHPSVAGALSDRMLAQWKQRRAARFNHELKSHQTGCTSCHVAVTGAARVGADTLFVPIQTCGRCHGAKSGSNKSRTVLANEIKGKQKEESFRCTKCHINLGDAPAAEIPRSHTAMIE